VRERERDPHTRPDDLAHGVEAPAAGDGIRECRLIAGMAFAFQSWGACLSQLSHLLNCSGIGRTPSHAV
jgi:hypothetical protein